MWTDVLELAARVPLARDSVLPSWLIDQPADAGLMAQLRPVGRVSVAVTPVAAPAPVLDTVTVKPIWAPAFAVAWSAVLVMLMLAQLTVTEAEAGSAL